MPHINLLTRFRRLHQRTRAGLIVVVLTLVVLTLALPATLRMLGHFLVVDDSLSRSDASVVLSTGIDYYPRLMQAADLYRRGLVAKVVINGNRKTDILRELEARGLKAPYPWYELSERVLEILGVPRKDILPVDAENAYDTVTEAQLVGDHLARLGIRRIVVTTSKSHTRRARMIWRDLHGARFEIAASAATRDPYDPDHWWRDGRQVRWVLSEYGAFLYYYWKR